MANPDAFIDEYISLYHPGEKFAQRSDGRGQSKVSLSPDCFFRFLSL